MKRLSIFLLASTALSMLLTAQIAPDKYYVQFTDKNNSPYSISNPEAYLSQRSIDRRATYGIAIDMKDLPVNPQYLEGVADAGATILNPTKWLNGVSIQTDNPAVIAAIEALPYVESLKKSVVSSARFETEKEYFANESFGHVPSVNAQMKEAGTYDYGPSFNQIHMLRGDEMHDLGFTGEGMIIGVLDAGYKNTDELPVFDSLWNNGQILGTYDFVDGGEVTFDKHSHGTAVLSTMGGNYPGEIVGTAPDAHYYLLRTEDGGSEYTIEEYNWVSGAEYADSVGADVLNTSLGYGDGFTDPTMNHTYADMDGNTTPITIGADIAASRGMVVVNSAGNSGSSAWYYITAPADGDSVFTIGSVNANGIPAGSSSNGPTYDGRTKPNVSAQGEGAYIAYSGGTFGYGNGTSFSSPIIAGMMACLWQANPAMNNMQLMNAVQENSSIANKPDNKMGWGIPDFMAANNFLSIGEEDHAGMFSATQVYPNPFTSQVVLSFSSKQDRTLKMVIVDMTGRTIFEDHHIMKKGANLIRINELESVPSGIYFLRLESGKSTITSKLVKN